MSDSNPGQTTDQSTDQTTDQTTDQSTDQITAPQLSAAEIAVIIANNDKLQEENKKFKTDQKAANKQALIDQNKFEELFNGSESEKQSLLKEIEPLRKIEADRKAQLLTQLNAVDDESLNGFDVPALESIVARFAQQDKQFTPPAGAGGAYGGRATSTQVNELAAKGDFESAWKAAGAEGVPIC